MHPKGQNMELRRTFQSLITLHQGEFPYKGLISRELALPLGGEDIVTVTGIRRCGKSSLLKLTINGLLAAGIPKERILYIEFDDERFSAMAVSDFDEILQAYREMYPEQPLSDVYMFFDEIQLIKGWELFVLRTFKNYSKHIFITGSTAEMLSGEMASALRGWPDEYVEYPLDFKEYLKFRNLAPDFFSEAGSAIAKTAYRKFCSEDGVQEILPRWRIPQGSYGRVRNGEVQDSPVVFQHYALPRPHRALRDKILAGCREVFSEESLRE